MLPYRTRRVTENDVTHMLCPLQSQYLIPVEHLWEILDVGQCSPTPPSSKCFIYLEKMVFIPPVEFQRLEETVVDTLLRPYV